MPGEKGAGEGRGAVVMWASSFPSFCLRSRFRFSLLSLPLSLSFSLSLSLSPLRLHQSAACRAAEQRREGEAGLRMALVAVVSDALFNVHLSRSRRVRVCVHVCVCVCVCILPLSARLSIAALHRSARGEALSHSLSLSSPCPSVSGAHSPPFPGCRQSPTPGES